VSFSFCDMFWKNSQLKKPRRKPYGKFSGSRLLMEFGTSVVDSTCPIILSGFLKLKKCKDVPVLN
jgi:hypothetical protein